MGVVTVESLRNDAAMWPERLVGVAGHARVLDGMVDACDTTGQLVTFQLQLADRSVEVVIGPLPVDHRQEAGMVEEPEPVLVRTASEVAASLQDVRVVVGVDASRDTSVFGYLVAQEQPDGLVSAPSFGVKTAASLGLPFDDFEAWLASPEAEQARAELEATGREVASRGGLGDPYAIILEASRRCGEDLARLAPPTTSTEPPASNEPPTSVEAPPTS